jgi:hypothetical protein
MQKPAAEFSHRENHTLALSYPLVAGRMVSQSKSEKGFITGFSPLFNRLQRD